METYDIDDLSIKLLARGHQLIVSTDDRLKAVQSHIQRINAILAKENDTKKLQALTASLKTLIEIETSIHQQSIVFFMAQYKPLKALIDNQKEIATDESSDLLIKKENNELSIHPDISEYYHKYED
jgi:hypothetical protein